MMTIVKVSSYIKAGFTFLALSLVCCRLNAQDISDVDLQLQLATQEATDYFQVKPSRSMAIIEANKLLLPHATDYYKFQYYRIGFWTAVHLYDNNKISHFAHAMAKASNFPQSKRYFHEMVNSLSLWYRVNQNYPASLTAGRCAIALAQTEQDISRNSVSAGLTYFLLNDFDKAKTVFELNARISEKTNNLIGLAAAENNLGLLHVFTHDFHVAEHYFRSALKINEEMARAKGTALNLVNLLLAFYIQEDWDNFYRLSSRANRSSQSLDNADIKQYFFWLKSAFAIKMNLPHAPQPIVLVNSYLSIKEPTVLKLIELLANTVDIELPARPAEVITTGLNVESTFPICKAVDNKALSLADLIDERLKVINQSES